MENERLYTESWQDYELIDAGGGKKLERWGKIITIRPEVQAYFKSEKTFVEWNELAHFEFVSSGAQSGQWKTLKKDTPLIWEIVYQSIKVQLELTKFKHIGLFPEQRINWDYISSHLSSEKRFLNLFAYTGAASSLAKATGAETVHVDSVKQLITWAKTNQDLSCLHDIKWVHEDALKFAEREIKRCNKYDGIIMDPPAWGIGTKGEKWKLEDKLEVEQRWVLDSKYIFSNHQFTRREEIVEHSFSEREKGIERIVDEDIYWKRFVLWSTFEN